MKDEEKEFSLNEEQNAAIHHTDTPLLVVAGAGSGKTLVITHKIKHIIDSKKAKPEEILAISFTNKAANEMKERVERLVENKTKKIPFIGTFHAFCGDVLRKNFHHIGGANSFVIYDSYEQLKLMRHLVKSHKIDTKIYSESSLLSTIDRIKNALVTPEDYISNQSRFNVDDVVGKMYKIYQEKLWQNNAVDFNDLILFTLRLFNERKDVLEKYQTRYPYLLVDEYQDTNSAQHQLIQCIATKNNHITLVGDFDQNIYSWRGANIQNILNFENDYKKARVITLEQNYRSTGKILEASNHLIKHNKKRKEKTLWTKNKDGHPLISYTAENEMEDAQYIVNEIRRLKQRGCSLNEMVILYRINALSRNFEEALNKDNIRYRLVGGVSFFDRKEIKDIVAYFRLIQNVHDAMSFMRICNVPNRALGNTSVTKLLEQSEQHGCSVYDLVRTGKVDLPSRSLNIVTEFFDMIDGFREDLKGFKTDKAAQLLDAVLERSGYKAMLENENTATSLDRLENLMEFKSYAREEELELSEFLVKISLITDIDQVDKTSEAVTLMTMHSAKGLEYDFVFVSGFEEGILPHYRSKNSKDELEEERRLCYVAITRAKKKVYLSNCVRRTLFGESRKQVTSRFLNEIPNHLLTHRSSESIEQRLKDSLSGGLKKASQIDFKKQPSQSYNSGDLVIHSLWGQGIVQRIEGRGEDAILHLNFEGLEKKLIAKYAPLKKNVGTEVS